MADPVEVKDDPPNLARIPPADLPQESWSDEGYSASGLFAAKLGESYHFGLKPLKENDPDKMRAAFEKGIAELLNYGSLPEVWQRGADWTGGDGVGDFERPYVESTRDERQSAVPLGDSRC